MKFQIERAIRQKEIILTTGTHVIESVKRASGEKFP